MSITLIAAVNRVFKMLDDDGTSSTDGSRWTTDEVEDALQIALDETVRTYCERGGNALDQVVELTTTATGTLDLAAYKPIRISSVSLKTGNTYLPMQATTSQGMSAIVQSAIILKIRYVGQPTFPDADGYVSYGTGTATTWPAFDQMLCIRAAQHLLIKEGETNPALDRQEDRLWQSVLTGSQIPTVYDFPSSAFAAWKAPYSWEYKPQQITIGYK